MTASGSRPCQFGDEFGVADRSDKQELSIEDHESRLVYRGSVDDERNTDNAWLETIVLHFHAKAELECPLLMGKTLDRGGVSDQTERTEANGNTVIAWVDLDDLSIFWDGHKQYIERVKVSLEQEDQEDLLLSPEAANFKLDLEHAGTEENEVPKLLRQLQTIGTYRHLITVFSVPAEGAHASSEELTKSFSDEMLDAMLGTYRTQRRELREALVKGGMQSVAKELSDQVGAEQFGVLQMLVKWGRPDMAMQVCTEPHVAPGCALLHLPTFGTCGVPWPTVTCAYASVAGPQRATIRARAHRATRQVGDASSAAAGRGRLRAGPIRLYAVGN